MLQKTRLGPRGGHFERVALGVAEHPQSAGREQRGEVDVIKHLLCKRGGTAADVLLAVRRIRENQIELATIRRELSERSEGVLHARIQLAWREIGAAGIVADEVGVLGGFLDAESAGRAAAERF